MCTTRHDIIAKHVIDVINAIRNKKKRPRTTLILNM